MRNLFNHPLGISMPNGNLFKRAGEELMAGADLGSALLYGLFSSRNAAASNAQQHNSAMILNKYQYKYNSDLLKQADQYSAQQFAREAAYNTPKAQAQRLAEAGLNPYLLMQDHGAGISLAAGNTSSHAVGSPSTGSGGALPARMADVPNFRGAVDRLYQSADLKNKQYESFAKLADSIPSLVKGVGADSAKKILSSAYGNIINTDLIERQVNAEVSRQEYETSILQIKSQVEQQYGMKNASNFVAIQEQSFNKMAAEIGLMASQGKVNEEQIKKLASDAVRNFADAYKLKREGDKYEIEGGYYSALTQLIGAQVDRQLFLNKFSGTYVGSPLYNYGTTSEHNKSLVNAASITDEQKRSQIIRALDKVLGEYLSIVNVSSSSQHTGFNINYNVP